ncbi:TIGR03943 family putative permease subunit [Paenibacillus glycanilyticus]|uniref:TIGR03943 family protein n=1 Tax=Paenibacillus glycanilyticus TaxID=126569 RepID=A0ABQ6G646_9BACL|nr:TIGR03943 family protein [Paenibacillus glycanilyticus]GLX66459.1 TIGR03943 family protein [Paenibacillus glycanilyticus]
MKVKGSTLAHRLIRSAVMFGFVWFIIQKESAQGLNYYVAPRMVPWVLFLAGGLSALALHQLYLAIRHLAHAKQAEAACHCASHGHDRWNTRAFVMYAALITPLLLAYSFPDAILGSQMAAQKGLNLTPSDVLKVSASPGNSSTSSPAFAFNDYTKPYADRAADMYKQSLITINDDLYIESLTSLDLYQDQFVGKKVQLSGYVYRLDSMNDSQFALGRFAMRCCVADSIPMGILVESDSSLEWKDDAYVVALGTIKKRQINGRSVLAIEAKTIQTQPSPQEPYVYGNPYFGA